MKLEGRVAWVTGGGSGLGRAICERFAAEGARVAVNDLREETAAQTAAALPGEGHLALAGDVSDSARVAEMAAEIAASAGRLDVLVNNAGFGIFKSIAEMSIEEWQRQIDVNLGGVFYLSKAALPHLSASGDGFIINIGSLAGRNTFAGGTGYNASKFGLVGMTEAMMLDVRHDDVRVSIIMPGSVNTAFGGKEQEAERSWPLQADDCALAVMQLLEYPKEAHVSRIEMRPAQPPRR